MPPPAILKRHETTEVEVRTLTFGDVRPAPPDISTPRPTLKNQTRNAWKAPGQEGIRNRPAGQSPVLQRSNHGGT